MKVWLISKKESNSDIPVPKCVVLVKPAASAAYESGEFTLVGSNDQKQALDAQTEVSNLSLAARSKLGITFKHVAQLQALAEPPLDIKPGDTVYASVNLRGSHQATGIYTWQRSAFDEYCQDTKVYPDVETYLTEKAAGMVNAEVASVSASTRRLLGLKV